VELSEENNKQLFIPQGFAHGFHVLSDRAVFTYKVDHPYMPLYERGLRFDDPAVGIDWGITDRGALILSEKDTLAPSFREAEFNFIFQ
jgi:dTDP-4-dehydrorhamnose 3,5-epimerase